MIAIIPSAVANAMLLARTGAVHAMKTIAPVNAIAMMGLGATVDQVTLRRTTKNLYVVAVTVSQSMA